MQNQQRIWLQFVVVILVALSLVGCTAAPAPSTPAAESGEEEGQPAAQTEGAPFEGVTLSVSTSDTYTNIFRQFEEQIRDELGVTFEFTINAPQDIYQKDMLEFAGGTSGHDIVLFQPAWIADYEPHLVDLGELAEQYDLNFHTDDMLPVFAESYTHWQDRFVGMPIDADQHNFYYNTAAFEDERNQEAYMEEYGTELKVPETWDEYVQVAEFFNGRDWDFDGEPEYGVAEAWQRGGYAFWWWASKFFSYGGIYFDEEMNPLINSPSGLRALEIQMAIRDFVPPGTTNFGSPEARNAWLNGEVPMVVHWTSSAKLAKNPESSQIVDAAGIALVPGVPEPDGSGIYRRPALPTGWVMGIPQYSDNQEAAARVIEFLVQPDRSLEISLNPDNWAEPWRQSSMDPEVWQEQWPDDPEYGQRVVAIMEQTVDLGVPDLQIPGQDEYVKALDAEINAALSGTKTAQQALDDAAAEWDAITDRLGREQQLQYWQQQLNAMNARGIEYRPELAQQ